MSGEVSASGQQAAEENGTKSEGTSQMAAPTALRELLITQLFANETNEASYSDYDTIGRSKKCTHIPLLMAFKRSGYLFFFFFS